MDSPEIQRIGLISDTHGLLRPEAIAFLRGCSLIIHGGDVGGTGILDDLRAVAPVTAVRGNNDVDEAAQALSPVEFVPAGRITILAVHDRATLEFDYRSADVRLVVSGHSHKPRIEEEAGILYVNPGSAGPRRFKLPVAIGELLIDSAGVTARVVDLQDATRILAGGSMSLRASPKTRSAWR